MGFADPTRAPRRLSCDGFSAPTRNREQQREAKARAARDRAADELAEQERELFSMQSSFAAYQSRLKGMAAQPMQMLGFSGGYQYPQVLPSNRKPAEDGLM